MGTEQPRPDADDEQHGDCANDLSSARAAATAAADELADTGSRYRTQWAMWVRALVLEADGDFAAALGTLTECWDRCTRSGLTLEYSVMGADLVRLALHRGQRQRAQEVAAAVAEVAAKNEVSSLTAAALRCRGLADDDPEILLAAAAAYARCPRPAGLRADPAPGPRAA